MIKQWCIVSPNMLEHESLKQNFSVPYRGLFLEKKLWCVDFQLIFCSLIPVTTFKEEIAKVDYSLIVLCWSVEIVKSAWLMNFLKFVHIFVIEEMLVSPEEVGFIQIK